MSQEPNTIAEVTNLCRMAGIKTPANLHNELVRYAAQIRALAVLRRKVIQTPQTTFKTRPAPQKLAIADVKTSAANDL